MHKMINDGENIINRVSFIWLRMKLAFSMQWCYIHIRVHYMFAIHYASFGLEYANFKFKLF